jgi:hypothetical protein
LPTRKANSFVEDVELDETILLRVTNNSDGVETVLNDLDLFFEKLSKEDDALIGSPKVLLVSIRDRSLSLPGHSVLS